MAGRAFAGDLRGVIDRRSGDYIRFARTDRGASLAPEELVPADMAAAEEGEAWRTATDELALLDAVGADVDPASFLAGDSTPVFAGSALTNFGVRMLLDAVVDLAPATVAACTTSTATHERSTTASPRSSSRSRRTWTRRTATVWPSPASALAASSVA